MLRHFCQRKTKNLFMVFLSFMDNTVDTATGTIKLKATFSNKATLAIKKKPFGRGNSSRSE